MPQLTSQRAKLLDDYIRQNPECKLPRTEKYLLKGAVHELDVYRLPLSLVTYNIRNGRFAAELREKEAELKRQLNPEDEKDAEILEDLLLKNKIEADYLRKSIIEKGQASPAAISHDGRIIDGNRRTAVLSHLAETDSKYEFLEAVRLPAKLDPKDLWRIEAGISLGHEFRVTYGPINELLKIKEGKDAGLTPKMIANTLVDNTEDDVLEKLERLRLIEDYLKKTGTPGKYLEAERRVEHFINLQNLMKTGAYRGLNADKKAAFLDATYDAILHGVTHMEVRTLRKVLEKKTVDRYVERHGTIKAENSGAPARKAPGSSEVDLIGEIVSGTPKKAAGKPKATAAPVVRVIPTPSVLKQKHKEMIAHAVEAAQEQDAKERPAKLLERAIEAVAVLAELDDAKLRPLAKDLAALEAKLAKIAKRASKGKP